MARPRRLLEAPGQGVILLERSAELGGVVAPMHFSWPDDRAGEQVGASSVPPDAAGADQGVDLVDEQDRVVVVDQLL